MRMHYIDMYSDTLVASMHIRSFVHRSSIEQYILNGKSNMSALSTRMCCCFFFLLFSSIQFICLCVYKSWCLLWHSRWDEIIVNAFNIYMANDSEFNDDLSCLSLCYYIFCNLHIYCYCGLWIHGSTSHGIATRIFSNIHSGQCITGLLPKPIAQHVCVCAHCSVFNAQCSMLILEYVVRWPNVNQ